MENKGLHVLSEQEFDTVISALEFAIDFDFIDYQSFEDLDDDLAQEKTRFSIQNSIKKLIEEWYRNGQA